MNCIFRYFIKMDFGTLLSVAQKNENSKQPIACYQTKFAPPKKPTKQAKALSDNIKKFLARKEEEEKRKVLEEKKKKENLLALRDHKTQSRINKHLKVCKAANKSAIEDAIDNENTAVTMAGPSQPDEDDYGYVSQEASAFYNQLMNKYNNAPPQKPLFSDSRKRTIKDIASTKDRVKQALKQQEVEEALGHRRKRKSSAKEVETEVEEKIEKTAPPVEDKKEKDEKPKIKKRPMPPPMDFNELLKIAEKKQHEPIVIEAKPKVEEPERLMTKKQMKEYAKEKEWRERKEQRSKVGNSNSKEGTTSTSKPSKTQDPAGIANQTSKNPKATELPVSNKTLTKTPNVVQSPIPKKVVEKSGESKLNSNKVSNSKTSERDIILEERKKLESEKRKLEEMRQAIEEEKKKLKLSKTKVADTKNVKPEKPAPKPKVLEKQVPSTSMKQKEMPATNAVKPRPPQMSNEKVRQFPPADLKPIRSKQLIPSRDQKKGLIAHKRRIQDEDEDEDYDSELDDFIDDEVEENTEDYSKYISQIFGYDKNKYKFGSYDEDDAAMESSFAQQLKEEYVSTKIGIMEDLEDMRMEALEKKRKAMLKKKVKH
ncbi:protein SPT2 homolog [Nomia melanderi]|uniref:protein SPT2 homolog n=1 Tax=Nomia melanderi TaxID=2448451 RepID=UPI001304720A|nr:protein SPT2 homolog [Nomia melanderi]XP_031833195.1 protein SPT2 homolog [Nomia melanderi]XP_031833196.1 protein SPT2 homolog [Nomia melanderi]XP_031833197.1 protein SPT2 homolog [Nomia melanderi]